MCVLSARGFLRLLGRTGLGAMMVPTTTESRWARVVYSKVNRTVVKFGVSTVYPVLRRDSRLKGSRRYQIDPQKQPRHLIRWGDKQLQGEIMSVLKRVEEAYLDVLRFIIIFVASVLLLGAIVFAVLAASNSGPGNAKDSSTKLTVNADDVTNGVVASKSSNKTPAQAISLDAEGERKVIDPNQALFERAAVAIFNFVNKHGRGAESIDKESVIQVSKRKASIYKEAEVAKEFASGLAATMEKTLADPKILKLVEAPAAVPPVAAPAQSVEGDESMVQAQPPAPVQPFKESPIGVVNSTLENYIALFGKQLAEKESERDKAAAMEIERKANATQQLYMAGGAFGTFLLLVFISIVVKIERNLRNLSVPPKS